MERETVNINIDDWGDFTGKGPWSNKGETYSFVEDKPSRDCDGDCHNIIVKRESDGKFFKFYWWWHPSSGDYIFEEHFLTEVFLKTTITYN